MSVRYRNIIRLDLDWSDSPTWPQYPDVVRRNLAGWQRFTKAKPAFLLTKLPLAEVIASPAFRDLSEFEQCLVLGEHKKIAPGETFEEWSERHTRFEATIKQNPNAYKLYQKYSSGQGP